MSGADMLAAAVNRAIPAAGPMAPRVGKIANVGEPYPGAGMFATITGILTSPLVVPQKCFSSVFLDEARARNLQNYRVLVIFTEGNQYVLAFTLPPIGP